MFEIEQAVRQVATVQSVAASDLRLIAGLRPRAWRDVLKALPLASRRMGHHHAGVQRGRTDDAAAGRTGAPAPDADIHHGGRVPPPPLRASTTWSRNCARTPETAAVAAIELAAHGAYNARQRCIDGC